MTRRRPRVEEIQDLNLYEQAEKALTIAHGRGPRPGPHGDSVIVSGAATPDYPEGLKRSKTHGRPARNVRIPSRLTSVTDQWSSW